MFLYNLRKLVWKLIYLVSKCEQNIRNTRKANFIPHIHLFFPFLYFKQEENLIITILTIWTQLYPDCLGDYGIQWAKTEPTLSGLLPIMLKMQVFLQVAEWCNHHNITKTLHLDIFQSVPLVTGLDECRIPGLNSLTKEMEKKKLIVHPDTFNYKLSYFFFNHCVHSLWCILGHRISYREFNHDTSNYRS